MPNRDHTWTAVGDSVEINGEQITKVVTLQGVSCEYTNQVLKFIGTISYTAPADATTVAYGIFLGDQADTSICFGIATVAPGDQGVITVEGVYAPIGELAGALFTGWVQIVDASTNATITGATITVRID